jgi:formylglycine-generating enzyme
MTGSEKSSCCAPSRGASAKASAVFLRTSTSNREGLISLPGGRFLMGSEGPEIWRADGEAPVREISLSPFWIAPHVVTNEQFSQFAEATGYVTEAERFGWSFVHHSQIDKKDISALQTNRVSGLEWWYRVDGAQWRFPIGPRRDFDQLQRRNHPVVHVSWTDAGAYAAWAGQRLPTEAEWEYAARGGLEGQIYPWGNELTPGGKHRCNIWQGVFPKEDTGADGYRGTAPARSFKPNGYGLYNMAGNTWEWVADWFGTAHHASNLQENPKGPPFGQNRVMKGGSYLCHASYCNRYRCSARTSNTPDTSAGHVGFRCVAD